MSISYTKLKPPRQGLARTERRSIWPAGIAACRRDCQKQQGDACLKLCLKIGREFCILDRTMPLRDRTLRQRPALPARRGVRTPSAPAASPARQEALRPAHGPVKGMQPANAVVGFKVIVQGEQVLGIVFGKATKGSTPALKHLGVTHCLGSQNRDDTVLNSGHEV